jgi:hypothetical protein
MYFLLLPLSLPPFSIFCPMFKEIFGKSTVCNYGACGPSFTMMEVALAKPSEYV